MEHDLEDDSIIRAWPANQAVLREARIVDVPPTARQRFVRWFSSAPLTLLAMWVFGIVVALSFLIILLAPPLFIALI